MLLMFLNTLVPGNGPEISPIGWPESLPPLSQAPAASPISPSVSGMIISTILTNVDCSCHFNCVGCQCEFYTSTRFFYRFYFTRWTCVPLQIVCCSGLFLTMFFEEN